jgi:2-iminobutanoate/2-iminopropanoate deaminase
MLIRAIAIALLLGLVSHPAAAATDRQFISNDPSTAPARAPFSNGVLVGDTLHIAGHLGVDPKTGRAPEDARVEAKLVMDGIKRTVEAAGLTMDDVVSIQIFCTDLALYDTFNAVYREYFPNGFPARAFLGASTLLRGAHFEVLGTAVRRRSTR